MDSVEDSDTVEDEVCYSFFFYCDIKTFILQHTLLKGQKETHQRMLERVNIHFKLN